MRPSASSCLAHWYHHRANLPRQRTTQINFAPCSEWRLGHAHVQLAAAFMNREPGHSVQAASVLASLSRFQDPAVFQQIIYRPVKRAFGFPTAFLHHGPCRREVAVIASPILSKQTQQRPYSRVAQLGKLIAFEYV